MFLFANLEPSQVAALPLLVFNRDVALEAVPCAVDFFAHRTVVLAPIVKVDVFQVLEDLAPADAAAQSAHVTTGHRHSVGLHQAGVRQIGGVHHHLWKRQNKKGSPNMCQEPSKKCSTRPIKEPPTRHFNFEMLLLIQPLK